MKRTPRLLFMTMAVVSVGLFAACGSSDPTATPTPGTAVEPTATPVQPTGFEAEWDALIAAAQAEGELVSNITGGGGPDMTPIYNVFSEKFGIRIALSRGSGRESAERMLAEQAAGRFTVDTQHTGETTAVGRFVPNNALQPIEPLLFHPEVIDKSNWYQGKFWFADEEQKYIFVYATSVSQGAGGPSGWYNTNLVSQDEVASWRTIWDMLDDKYAGQIVSRSPQDAGASQGWLETYLNPNMGPEYFERLFGDPSLGVFFTTSPDVMTDQLSFGAKSLGISLGATDLEVVRDAGGPVAQYSDTRRSEGWPFYIDSAMMSASGLDGLIMLPKNPPHPNATKLFVNWLFSREGQTLVQGKATLRMAVDGFHDRQSLRVDDIPKGLVRPSEAWDPNIKYGTVRMDPIARRSFDEVVAWVRAVHQAGYIDGTALPPRPVVEVSN